MHEEAHAAAVRQAQEEAAKMNAQVEVKTVEIELDLDELGIDDIDTMQEAINNALASNAEAHAKALGTKILRPNSNRTYIRCL